ncbi:hypothetical protein M8C21_018145 [Ambrosia artemisiifolia]|uniref:Uncharacterized protein n=1 Tax=Ambrosia artemisiifolia TaxID=4212 RepID=A0AAD5BLV7_AMBAR|nr:hypothetical protein M8C21_018145 [Ambrosia artemisiifolia]
MWISRLVGLFDRFVVVATRHCYPNLQTSSKKPERTMIFVHFGVMRPPIKEKCEHFFGMLQGIIANLAGKTGQHCPNILLNGSNGQLYEAGQTIPFEYG